MEETELNMVTMEDLTPGQLPTWCGGCGGFNILHAVKGALVDLQIPREKVFITTGIGCGSKITHFIKTYGFEGLHGRSIAVASGAKLANKDLKVIAIAGDGDTYGIGGNHFIHAMRRNLDITVIVQNNEVYGLTKGQYSPTSLPGFKSPSSPFGAIDGPVNPPALAMTMGASYVARGYAFEVKHLQRLIAEGLKHKGFSLIDSFQPCATYNKVNTLAWYKERLYKLEDEGHNPEDKEAAFRKAREWGQRIPIGLFFREEKPSYEEVYVPSQKPVVKQDVSRVDISPIMNRLK